MLSPLTGIGNYTYQVAKSLRELDAVNDYSYFYGYYSKQLFCSATQKGVFFFNPIKEFVKKIPGLGNTARKLNGAVNYFSRRSYDLYFEPNFIPINIKAKTTIVSVCDFSWKLYPQWHPKERVSYFEENFFRNITRADRIIFISDYIRKEAIKLFDFPADKLKTIHLGFDKEIFKHYSHQELQVLRVKYNLPEKFILFVSSSEPRKNLKNLILAYSKMDEDIQQNYKLVLTGVKGWNDKEIIKLLDKLKDRVTYLGYVSNTELCQLYNLATLLVFPSFYEGFGLPPLEAMACGCPVVTSNTTSLPEVCGDAAIYVEPSYVDSIAEGIYKVITNEELRKTLIQKGFANAAKFSWTKCAQEHLKVFEEAAGS